MEKRKKRPAWVQKAVVNDDLATLRFAAEKSNEKQAKKREQVAEEGTFYREREIARGDEEATRAAEENREHIVPIDPEKEDV